MARRPHVLIISYPAQGHIRPLMKLSQDIANQDIKVTFVNTEFIHTRILEAALPNKNEKTQSLIEMVSIPDGLEAEDNREDIEKLVESMTKVMPSHMENLIKKINQQNIDEEITCVIADSTVDWALWIAKKMGIKRAMFSASTVASIAVTINIPKLLEAGIIDENGTPMKDEMLQFSQDMHTMKTIDVPWICPSDLTTQKVVFKHLISSNIEAMKISNWLLCNSFYELDPPACKLIPDLLSIGPLLAEDQREILGGNFWPEDLTCLNWLDGQPLGSVIYIAFGSIAVLGLQQIEELALGLELTGRPFLWVVRSDIVNGSNRSFLDKLLERIGDQGKVIIWAPQERVLAHHSIACFLTHCGWNSTIEGLSMGVSFLCWPFFADQIHISTYITDVWKTGLKLNQEQNGVISRHEISKRIQMLLSDGSIKANAQKLKKMSRDSISDCGSSMRNFQKFITQIKG